MSLDQFLAQETLNSLDVAFANQPAAVDFRTQLEKSLVKRADKLITSAQVLALNATPITLVAAPGAGKYLEFLGAAIFLDYGGTAYASDAGEDLVVKWTNAAGAAVSNSIDGTVFHATADALAYARPLNTAADVLVSVVNSALVLHLLVGEWITGNSPLKVRTWYREHKLSELEGIA